MFSKNQNQSKSSNFFFKNLNQKKILILIFSDQIKKDQKNHEKREIKIDQNQTFFKTKNQNQKRSFYFQKQEIKIKEIMILIDFDLL